MHLNLLRSHILVSQTLHCKRSPSHILGLEILVHRLESRVLADTDDFRTGTPFRQIRQVVNLDVLMNRHLLEIDIKDVNPSLRVRRSNV